MAQLVRARDLYSQLVRNLEETRSLARSAAQRITLDDKLRVASQHLRDIEAVIDAVIEARNQRGLEP
jgi:hypothetical protein